MSLSSLYTVWCTVWARSATLSFWIVCISSGSIKQYKPAQSTPDHVYLTTIICLVTPSGIVLWKRLLAHRVCSSKRILAKRFDEFLCLHYGPPLASLCASNILLAWSSQKAALSCTKFEICRCVLKHQALDLLLGQILLGTHHFAIPPWTKIPLAPLIYTKQF